MSVEVLSQVAITIKLYEYDVSTEFGKFSVDNWKRLTYEQGRNYSDVN